MRAVLQGLLLSLLVSAPSFAAELKCRVRDAQTGQPLPVRVYLQGADGTWYFAKSAAAGGSAVEYRKQRFEKCVEMHTTVSAHPFVFDVPAGKCTLTVERGKEYFTSTRELTVGEAPQEVEVKLRRWIDMAARGWYSGDTHVHRLLDELPNVVLAEDLNVALPLSYWVTASDTPPASGDKNTGKNLKPQVIAVDRTHVIYPINTEYEIFTVQGKRHTLGAVFILNHKQPIGLGVPPVGPIAVEARKQGGLLDLDKHSWPWSMMLIPVMNVDLFELANNHVWRTEFGFSKWTIETLPAYMQLETTPAGFTEWGWINFGFQNYYALLNCGYKLRPTAGTASGVHPVPLGFGRVYVQVEGDFSYPKWIAGLDAGRSFVTTGPMLSATVAGQPMGGSARLAAPGKVPVAGTIESAVPLERIEVIVNGVVHDGPLPPNRPREAGGYSSPFELDVPLESSGWVAVRAFEARPDKRVRFAHSAPVHIEMPDRPLRPRKAEVEYLVHRVEEEIKRNQQVLSPEALAEYRRALEAYQALLPTAR